MENISINYHNRPISHYIHDYIFLQVLPTIRAIAVGVAALPPGGWAFKKIDAAMATTADAVLWSPSSSSRTTSWLYFLPLLFMVGYVRMLISMASLIIFRSSFTTMDFAEIINKMRTDLQAIGAEGEKYWNETGSNTMENAKNLIAGYLYGLSEIWPWSRIFEVVQRVLITFGILTITEVTEESPKKERQVTFFFAGKDNSDEPESEHHRKEGHSQEGHHHEDQHNEGQQGEGHHQEGQHQEGNHQNGEHHHEHHQEEHHHEHHHEEHHH